MSKIKDLVKDQEVHFIFYRDQKLWYSTDSGYEFPVPIDDIGNATFNRNEKAILFMRYIRKHMELEEEARQCL